MAVEIIYETHSISTDNEAGVATGWLPGRLLERGRVLAAELGQRRRNDDIAAVYSSDLRRAVETAEIAFAESGIPLHQDARLRECNYGELNGAPVAVLAQERARRIDTRFPGGQSYRDVVEQTASFLRDVANRHDGQRILIIAHSANRWALECLLNGACLADLVDAPFDWQEGWRYLLPTGWTGIPATANTNERDR
jgi:alpha-ribazole phosphatase/probable phosphoglycerate mutase